MRENRGKKKKREK